MHAMRMVQVLIFFIINKLVQAYSLVASQWAQVEVYIADFAAEAEVED